MSIIVLATVCCLQGDYVWIDPETNGEFDVAIGGHVKTVDGDNVCLVDDDNKVDLEYLKKFDFTIYLLHI